MLLQFIYFREAENKRLLQENQRLRKPATQWSKAGPGCVTLDNGSVLIGSNQDVHIMHQHEYMDCYTRAKNPKGLDAHIMHQQEYELLHESEEPEGTAPVTGWEGLFPTRTGLLQFLWQRSLQRQGEDR